MRRPLVALVVAVLAACGDAAPAVAPSPATSPAVPALDVEVELSRSAAGRGVFEIVLTTPGEEPLMVTRLQLLDDRFARVPPEPKSTRVPAGGRRIVTPVPAAEARCDDATTAAPRVAVRFTSADGTVHDVVVPVGAAGDEVLTRVHADACRRRAATEAATVAFGDAWQVTGPAVATGVLRLERGAATGPVTVEDVQGTVIFSLRVLGAAGGGPVLTLEEGSDAAEVAIEVSAARCDPHALIESKKTYLFPTWVRVGDEATVFLTTEPEGAARDVLERLLQEGCHGEEAHG